jgi:protein ImuB
MERSDSAKTNRENAQPAYAEGFGVAGAHLSRRSSSEGGTPNAQRPTPEKASQEIINILHKWGIHTLGQLAALDKEELRARLGPNAIRLWERANGTATRLLKFVQPPESFEEIFEFEHEIETAEPLLFMLRRVLEQLAFRLSGIYLVARELTLRISFANKQSYERVFKIPQPTHDVDLLFRMLHTHLENFKSEHPIVAVAVIAEPTRPASQQFGLFETALRNPQQLYETLARLTALLGTDRVGTPLLEETHRPDAFRMEPFSWNLNLDGLPHRLAAASAPLPQGEGRVRASDLASPRVVLRRFRPAAAAVIFTSDSRHVQSEKIAGKVVDHRGPYLLSGNWWDEKSWARAEWDLQLENAELVRAHETEGTWKVDGIYD